LKYQHNLIFIISTLFFISLFASCKKGKDDPTISLLTRKARLSNDWQIKQRITENQVSNKSTSASNVITTLTSAFVESYDNTDYTYSFTAPNTTNKLSFDTIIKGTVAIHRMSFYKDGTWNREQEYVINYDSTINNVIVKIERKINEQTQGVWAFLRGTKPDRKDKEEIELAFRQAVIKTNYAITFPNNITPTTTTNETITTTYQDNERNEIWRLLGLRGNKITASIENKPQIETKIVSQTVGGQPTTVTITRTVKQITNILLQD
jgi:hypothetical protein